MAADDNPQDDTDLADLEAAAEAAYTRVRAAPGRAALHGAFSDMKSAFHAAIAGARDAGLNADAARLERRLDSIRAEADEGF